MAAADADVGTPGADGARRFSGAAGIAALDPLATVRTPQPGAFRAELRRFAIDHVIVAALGATPHRGSWRPVADGDGAVRLVVVISGAVLLPGRAGLRPLEPGSMLVGSPALPLDYESSVPTRVAAVTVRRPRVPAFLGHLPALTGGPVAAVVRAEDRTPTMSAFSAFLLPFATGPLDAGGVRLAGTGLADLALAVLVEVADRADLSDAERLWLAANGFIEQHLGAPDLTPAAVAAGTGASPRSLQVLFQQHGSGIARTVRLRRLEVAARALAEEPADPGTGALAARLGFAGSDQFARAFRARYGLPPGEYRARARG